MGNPNLAASLVAAMLAFGGIGLSPFERWAYGADAGATRKFLAYGVVLLYLWVLTGMAVSIYGWIPLLILQAPTLPPIVAPLLVPVLVAFFVLALMPLLQSLRGLRWRQAYQAAIRREFTKIPGLVPNTAAERAVWIVISLTAGICEEVLFRGFLIRFLHESSLALPIAGALAVSSVLFGLGHLYQGFKSLVTTTIAGLCFGLLFLLSGSLLPGIVLHALMDLQIAYVMRPIPASAAVGVTEMA